MAAGTLAAWVALLAGMATFSGCLDAGDFVEPPFPAVGPGFEARFDHRTGGVQGLVYDPEWMPLEGADVLVKPRAFQTRTGADGSFVLDYVTPGPLEITVQSPDHEPLTKNVRVTAGRATFVFFLLDWAPDLKPRAVPTEFTAYIGCGVGLVGASTTACGDADPSQATAFNVDVRRGPTTIVVSARWQANETTPLPVLEPWLHFVLRDTGGETVAEWDAAPNVTTHRLDGPDLGRAGTWTLEVSPGQASFDHPEALGGLQVGQRVDVVVTLAYLGYALPAGYTGLAWE